ncbi:MAG: L,D-transpeptidase family protein [Candidatus Sedimenticola sp. PURPLELP]
MFFALACFTIDAVGASTLPGHVFARDVSSETTVLVDKASQSAYLVSIDNDQPKLVRSFDDLLFGENGGDKTREGDKRTPEGVYRITHFIPDDKLAPIYGSGAFPIDYPNPLDKIEGRNGSGIWLHGKDYEDPKKRTTRGCVAFNNNEIGELRNVLAPDTPVIITRKAEFLEPTEYLRQRENLLGVLDSFINSWEQGDMEQLGNFLHADFLSDGKTKEGWLAHKRRLKSRNGKRSIETDNIYVFKENGDKVVFDFTQLYCASNIVSRGQKKLYFQKDGDQLRLITESFRDLPSAPLVNHRVETFVKQWLSAWKGADLNRYLELYGDGFKDNRGRDLAQWGEYKKRLFSERPNQKIEIDNIQVRPIKGDRYQVSFRQRYQSSNHSDYGIKTLMLDGCPGKFKIVSERWRAVREEPVIAGR